MKTVTIQNKIIGDGQPAYVIAEVGINHNGDVKLARETIDAALENGADAVKLQTYKTEGFIHPQNRIFPAVKSCELTRDEYAGLFEHAQKRGGCVFSTPECLEDIQFLKEMDPPAMKIASMDLNYREFVKAVARMQKPVILSTGMSFLNEVQNSVRWIEEEGNRQIILLHCVSCYPTPSNECNLRAINTLSETFGYPAGFSDHTKNTFISFAAVCLGASVIEKHFTLDKKLPGPDHAGSADPRDLAQMVAQIRAFEQALGSGIKEPSASEKITRLTKRRSVFALNDLPAGHTLKQSDLVFLTPSVPESQLENTESFTGRRLKKALRKFELITGSVFG